MSNSPDELEREVEASRGRLDRTLGDLQGRLAGAGIPRSLVDLRQTGEAASERVERFVDDVRTDPIPALLIAAGFGLLVYEAFRASAERRGLTVVSSGSALATTDGDVPGNRRARVYERLDEGLEETFPGSDPVSVRITK